MYEILKKISILPFFLLIFSVALGPLLYNKIWHKYYKIVCVLTGFIIFIFDFIINKNIYKSIHCFLEYFQFISFLFSLYIISGSIKINIISNKNSIIGNFIFFSVSTFFSNIIGTTAASILFIKPFINYNKFSIKPYHIVFFCFIVSNIGGALTPIGDAPLLLGFLKGVPFFWTLKNCFFSWIFSLFFLFALFFIFEKKNKVNFYTKEKIKIEIEGKKNFLFLFLNIIFIFLDPNAFDFVPFINIHGQKISFIREIFFLANSFFVYKKTDKNFFIKNNFSFEPILEVIFLFFGIFLSLSPVLDFIYFFSKNYNLNQYLTPFNIFWTSGFFSSFLDNAPTYLNFLTASMACENLDINNVLSIKSFAKGEYLQSLEKLKAISISSVFFGSMTYIGNGPNMIVKSISENLKIKLPTFFEYIYKYSFPILIPLFILCSIFII